MKERNASRRPRMSFLKMDMTQMEFPDASFQVVLDKGTLDAVLTDEEEKTLQQVDRMLAEVGRVLQVGGRYLCISLAQAHVLKKAVGHFSEVCLYLLCASQLPWESFSSLGVWWGLRKPDSYTNKCLEVFPFL